MPSMGEIKFAHVIYYAYLCCMSDNSVIAVMIICLFTYLTMMVVFGTDTPNQEEKTKQMELQWKMDSVASLQVLPLNEK